MDRHNAAIFNKVSDAAGSETAAVMVEETAVDRYSLFLYPVVKKEEESTKQ